MARDETDGFDPARGLRFAAWLARARAKDVAYAHWPRLKRSLARKLGVKAAAPVARAAPRPLPRSAFPKDVILVRLYDGWGQGEAYWGDAADALHYMTKAGAGRWGDVQFTTLPVEEADYHVFLNNPLREPLTLDVPPSRVWFTCGEPPIAGFRGWQSGQGEGTVVVTSDPAVAADTTLPRHVILAPVVLKTWSMKYRLDDLLGAPATEKFRNFAWVGSNKVNLKGHRDRLDFVERLGRATRLDLYGRGFWRIYDKWDAIAPYRYALAYENCYLDWYFSEKLMDVFVAGTMPVYFGSPIITRFFPAESLLALAPGDPDAVAKVAEFVASDAWKRHADAVAEAKRLVLTKYNAFAFLADAIATDPRPAGSSRPITIEPMGFDDWQE